MHRCQTRIEPRPRGACLGNLLKFNDTWAFLRYARKHCRQIDRHTDPLLAVPCISPGSKVNSKKTANPAQNVVASSRR